MKKISRKTEVCDIPNNPLGNNTLPPPPIQEQKGQSTCNNSCNGSQNAEVESKTEKKQRTSKRDSNIELLRIIAITFVLILHTRFDGILSVYDNSLTLSHICRFAFESFAIVGVNEFVMISGYYCIKLSARTVIRYSFQVYYFAIIALLIMLIVSDTTVGKDQLIRLMFPISHNVWFVSCYFILMLLAPMLNSFIEKTSLKILTVYTTIIYVISYVWSNIFQSVDGFGGYSWGFFIVLYLIGAIINKWNKCNTISKKAAFGGYILFSILIIGIAIIQTDHNYGRSLLWSYDSPLVVASSVSLFLFFSNLKVKFNQIINILGGSTLAILLLHMSPMSGYFSLHEHIFKNFHGITVIGYSALIILVYFFAAVILDQPRKYLSNRFLSNIGKR